ncbi:chloride channel protein, partial [Streptococcus pyogenes]
MLGILLGLAGYFYEVVILNIQKFYHFIIRFIPIPAPYFSSLAFFFILPIGYYMPGLLGGGHHLILELPHTQPSLNLLFLFLIIRFIWSMISYGSGMPGGIFLPILSLGSILGMLVGTMALSLGLIEQEQITMFLVLG